MPWVSVWGLSIQMNKNFKNQSTAVWRIYVGHAEHSLNIHVLQRILGIFREIEGRGHFKNRDEVGSSDTERRRIPGYNEYRRGESQTIPIVWGRLSPQKPLVGLQWLFWKLVALAESLVVVTMAGVVRLSCVWPLLPPFSLLTFVLVTIGTRDPILIFMTKFLPCLGYTLLRSLMTQLSWESRDGEGHGGIVSQWPEHTILLSSQEVTQHPVLVFVFFFFSDQKQSHLWQSPGRPLRLQCCFRNTLVSL